ncbi:MAG: hypothetical protein IT236_18330 [Bacteroidia bacterium]|nr:hypothetical protein [Bacteroidia bacterium]
MLKHEYIVERLERRTYIKGVFKGKFVGNIDALKSVDKYERYFDIEITEGDIYTTQDNLKKWPQGGDFKEFENVSTFPTSLPAHIKVTLEYLNGSIKHFKVRLREVKLINCRLFNQMHRGNEVFGELEGYVSGYLLHNDTIISEIADEKRTEEFVPPEIKNYAPQNSGNSTFDQNRSTTALKNHAPVQTNKQGCLPVLSGLFGLIFLGALLVIFKHWFVFVLFCFLAIKIIPSIYRWFIVRFKFRHSSPIAALLSFLIYIFSGLILLGIYVNTNKNNSAAGLVAEKRRQETPDMELKKQQYRDSFNHYYNYGIKQLNRRKKQAAVKAFETAGKFASEDEKNTLNTETNKLYNSLAEDLFKNAEYAKAIEAYSTLIRTNPGQSSYLFQRAQCYLQSNKTKDAVNDLKQAVDLGNNAALLLYEKINPLKKRVAYYVTRCCDGTTSSAKGRGACSHHGGVCDWNEPVYEEYREY